MKITFSWLKEHLNTQASLSEICDKLTDIGLEVENIEDSAQNLEKFEVAQIIEATPAPNSNKLKICQVAVNNLEKPLQIICGAANARTGIKVAYAPIGSIIPSNQMTIKKAKIAGIESNGMLCSATELKLGSDDSGIIEIDDKHPIGTKIAEVFGRNQQVIDINITPNRGDCLGVVNIARDLAATGIGTFIEPKIDELKPEFSFDFNVKNEAPDACSYAAFCHIKNVKNCPSPQWLQDKLNAVGINPISAIVDITNYVMLLLNRPMHAYDANKISDDIIIRNAKNDEKFTSLKDQTYSLDDKILTISDSQKPLAIAGVIGSLESACQLETNEIILESAFFTATNIAYSGRKLNILSDARYRFERGVDYATCEMGIKVATKLILEICGGDLSETKVIGAKLPIKTINFNLNKIKKLIGLEVKLDQASEILQNLGFKLEVKSDNNLIVGVPSHRHDINIEQDLVEEIIRIIGYNHITKNKLNLNQQNSSNISQQSQTLNQIRQHLANNGMLETINWSFNNSNLIELFGKTNPKLTIANPISVELNHMRCNLIIGLLESYRKNSLRNFDNLSLFEIGNIFEKSTSKLPGQKLMISGLRAGKNKEQDHYHDQRDFDIFDVKKDFYQIVNICGLKPENLQISSENAPKYYHPHRFAACKLGKNLIGYFGELHPQITKKFNLKNRVNIFEIFFDQLPKTKKSRNIKAFSINDLPIVERDFAFLVNKDQEIDKIIKTISNCDKKLIKEVNIFDIFSGNNIDKDKKSIALRVKIEPQNQTLTSKEIDDISQKIITTVSSNCNATLRE